MSATSPLSFGTSKIENPSRLNIIVGRNGSGKSRFLREISKLRDDPNHLVRYISPERGGPFEHEPGVESAIRSDNNWLEKSRSTNQSSSFKQVSAFRIKELAMLFAVRIESDNELRKDLDKTFVSEQLSKINRMLSNVIINREGAQEFFLTNHDGVKIKSEGLSSGESEILSMSVEILHFFAHCKPEKINILLLDEPDAHLHPDLQARLARFLIREIDDLLPEIKSKVFICIATHSTPLICELSNYSECTIGTKNFESTTISQSAISKNMKKMAPFFGHPLSKIISNDIPLIIEGEDDERIWQQASRTAKGRLKIFPILAEGTSQQTSLENDCDSLMRSIYDDPLAISIRDGDGSDEKLQKIGCVIRFRLQCYAAENLLLTDDVLKSFGIDWIEFKYRTNSWCKANSDHKYTNELIRLIDSDTRLRNNKIKNIRQLIPAILESKKPWEVHVGQTLGRIDNSSGSNSHSLVEYVGENALKAIGLLS